MSAYVSDMDYIVASDEKGYHITVYSDIKEIGTAQVSIEEFRDPLWPTDRPSVHHLHVSGARLAVQRGAREAQIPRASARGHPRRLGCDTDGARAEIAEPH